MATLATLQTQVALKLIDQNNRSISAAQITTLLNEAIEHWVNETEEILQTNAYSVTAKQLIYSAPTDIITLKRAEFAPMNYIPLEIVNYAEMQGMAGYNLTFGSSNPIAIEMFGLPNSRLFKLWPPPGTTSATTTCDGAISSTSAATIEVVDASQFRSPAGYVQIDNEKIMYQNLSTSDNNILLCRRGEFGTTAATHANGATITQLDLVVMYSRRAAALSAAGDIPEIDARYHNAIVMKAVAEALKSDGRPAEAAPFDQEYLYRLNRAKRDIKKIQQASPNIMLLGGSY